MAFSDDVSNEYLHWDNPEAVTFRTKRHTGVTLSIATAVRESLQHNDSFFNGIAISGNELFWNIPVALMDDEEVKRGDEIEDQDDVIYSVKTAVKTGTGRSYSHWKCLTIEVP